MKLISILIGFILSSCARGSSKFETWFPPLLTLPQISERFTQGQTRGDIVGLIPFRIELLNMPRSGALREYAVMIIPKAGFDGSHGIYLRFEDESDVLLRQEDWKLQKQPFSLGVRKKKL